MQHLDHKTYMHIREFQIHSYEGFMLGISEAFLCLGSVRPSVCNSKIFGLFRNVRIVQRIKFACDQDYNKYSHTYIYFCTVDQKSDVYQSSKWSKIHLLSMRYI